MLLRYASAEHLPQLCGGNEMESLNDEGRDLTDIVSSYRILGRSPGSGERMPGWIRKQAAVRYFVETVL